MKTSFSKLAIVAALSLTSLGAMAAGNNGKVTFSGEVVDAPCSLAPGQDGTDIKVDFGQLSMAQLNKGNQTPKNFNIQLEDCDLTGKTAQITFTSADQLTGKNLLGTRGGATGLAIGLSDANGSITFGTAKTLTGLNATGNNTLTYTATAQKADAGVDVTAGDFEAITNFLIAYQ
ncbi:type 1 fimbrial protein [Serratia marcescens]|uniref:fimbrial protein n=1 Tax=Serratia marcescens TaxID=615 RepID=UPI00117CAC53|nr:fimbrial protein [Serratia marcescens]TSB25739.1 type 1 fimbrial protein [Serratia marcescens]TXE43912.1 type 1 fimbrial protein [Serratia marcescens]